MENYKNFKIQMTDGLFINTEKAFLKSDIKNFADKSGEVWNYSISSTKLTNDSTLLIGFNWGAEINMKYDKQKSIPKETFNSLYSKGYLGSFQRIYRPLKNHFPTEDIDSFTQTNFCFFRSKSEGQISDKDLKLSNPLFNELLGLLVPKRIIGFSSKLKQYMLESKLCNSYQELNIPSNSRTLNVGKGDFIASQNNIPIYFLPHPNSKFTNESRKLAWDFCFKPFNLT